MHDAAVGGDELGEQATLGAGREVSDVEHDGALHVRCGLVCVGGGMLETLGLREGGGGFRALRGMDASCQ